MEHDIRSGMPKHIKVDATNRECGKTRTNIKVFGKVIYVVYFLAWLRRLRDSYLMIMLNQLKYIAKIKYLYFEEHATFHVLTPAF